MKKKLIIASSIFLILLIALFALWYFFGNNTIEKQMITVQAKKGDFNISITTSGELQAKSYEYIYGPSFLKDAGIWQFKINDIVPEGSYVKKGEFVASIDPGEINNKIKEIQADIDKNMNSIQKVQLDTTLELRNERDKLALLKLNYEESKVTLEQSKYEPQNVIRQAEISVGKAKNAFDLAKKNYNLKLEQNINKMQDINSAINNAKSKLETLNLALNSLTVRAPKNGIIIYRPDKGSGKIGAGSIISVWSNIIAIMPDLSQIVSKTFINEMDISKISEGMEAEVTIDAFPDKKFQGNILSIANIGETLPNSDLKVYEVGIILNTDDTSLKPSMTTKNVILLTSIKDVVFIPIECIHSDGDITYVFKQTYSGIIKAEVKTGQSNDNEIIILNGIEEGETIYMTIPKNADKMILTKLNQ